MTTLELQGVLVSSCSSRDTSQSFLTAENMADEHGRKWDRCIADTAVKTGKYALIRVKSQFPFTRTRTK